MLFKGDWVTWWQNMWDLVQDHQYIYRNSSSVFLWVVSGLYPHCMTHVRSRCTSTYVRYQVSFGKVQTKSQPQNKPNRVQQESAACAPSQAENPLTPSTPFWLSARLRDKGAECWQRWLKKQVFSLCCRCTSCFCLEGSSSFETYRVEASSINLYLYQNKSLYCTSALSELMTHVCECVCMLAHVSVCERHPRWQSHCDTCMLFYCHLIFLWTQHRKQERWKREKWENYGKSLIRAYKSRWITSPLQCISCKNSRFCKHPCMQKLSSLKTECLCQIWSRFLSVRTHAVR